MRNFREWGPEDEPQARGQRSVLLGAKRQTHHMVSPSEGNEARREGHRKSHTFVVPLKPGNLYRGDPVEGREVFVVASGVGNPSGTLYPGSGSTAHPRIAKRESESMTGRTGCLNWARPDLWELRGAIPEATRPFLFPLRRLGKTDPFPLFLDLAPVSIFVERFSIFPSHEISL